MLESSLSAFWIPANTKRETLTMNTPVIMRGRRPNLPNKTNESMLKITMEAPKPIVALRAVNSAVAPLPPAVSLKIELE